MYCYVIICNKCAINVIRADINTYLCCVCVEQWDYLHATSCEHGDV